MDREDAFYEACISRIADGDKDAIAMLYESVKNAVYGFALSILRDTRDAEDILQDTFVSIHASAQNYKKMGKPMAWILTITRNLSLMKIRSRQKTAVMAGDEASLFAEDETRLPNEEKWALTAALQKISTEESQIVMLHAIAGFKHREIADVLDLPLSTVLSKYSRAIRKLKLLLEEGEHHGK